MVHAGRLAENLELRAGAQVLLDIESIPPGVSFPDYIEREIAACDVVLAMIGDDWLTIVDSENQPRIADPSDWVHLEIAAALDRGVLTIPVLVEGARMPRTDDLPAPLAAPGQSQRRRTARQLVASGRRATSPRTARARQPSRRRR